MSRLLIFLVFAIASPVLAVQPDGGISSEARWSQRKQRDLASARAVEGTLVCDKASGEEACSIQLRENGSGKVLQLVGGQTDALRRMFDSGVRNVRLEGTRPETDTLLVTHADRM